MRKIEKCFNCEHFGTDDGRDGWWFTCWHPSINGTKSMKSALSHDAEDIIKPDWCPLLQINNKKNNEKTM